MELQGNIRFNPAYYLCPSENNLVNAGSPSVQTQCTRVHAQQHRGWFRPAKQPWQRAPVSGREVEIGDLRKSPITKDSPVESSGYHTPLSKEGERERCLKTSKLVRNSKFRVSSPWLFLQFVSQCGVMRVRVGRVWIHTYSSDACVCVQNSVSLYVLHVDLKRAIKKDVGSLCFIIQLRWTRDKKDKWFQVSTNTSSHFSSIPPPAVTLPPSLYPPSPPSPPHLPSHSFTPMLSFSNAARWWSVPSSPSHSQHFSPSFQSLHPLLMSFLLLFICASAVKGEPGGMLHAQQQVHMVACV